jgi:hypothetical protein
MTRPINKEEDAILYLFHVNKIFACFMEFQPFVSQMNEDPSSEQFADVVKQAKLSLEKMEKALAEEPPKTISAEDRDRIRAVITSLTNKNDGPSILDFLQASPMKTDLLKFMNQIRSQIDANLPEIVLNDANLEGFAFGPRFTDSGIV